MSRLRAAAIALAIVAALVSSHHAEDRRHVIAFANDTEEPGVTVEGTGFTGREVRESMALAARRYSIDLIFYDNRRDAARIVANAEDAAARNVDLYVLYARDQRAAAAAADRLRAAGIPLLTVNVAVPGVPQFSVDNRAAGRIAGTALADFGARTWRDQRVLAVIVGAVAGDERLRERADGIVEGVRGRPGGGAVTTLDTGGNPAQVAPALGRFLAAHPGAKILVAALDDATALAAKSALESAGRAADAVIVGHGADTSVRGGVNDKKEIHPFNRGSILIGSVAFYLDRLGYDVLPLALRMLKHEPIPARTTVRHTLITPANVFREYPPSDMN
jgi:ABC-type sugar transport system substrate-binding protein